MADENTAKVENDSEFPSKTTTDNGKEEVKASEGDQELDDLLDSALEDFDKPNTVPKPSAPTDSPDGTSQDSTPSHASQTGADALLQDLMGDVFAGDAAAGDAHFEDIMKELMGDSTDLARHFEQLSNLADKVDGSEESQRMFASTLEQTMNSLAENTETLEGDISEEELLRAMSSMGLAGGPAGGPAGGGGADAGFMSSMQGMMKSLLSKEVLYPSMKDISTRYPDWLSENNEKVSSNDLERYRRQFELMQRVCEEFESESDKDSEDAKSQRFERILDIMQQMQSCGQPPEELVGDMGQMPPGLDGKMPAMPEQCSIM